MVRSIPFVKFFRLATILYIATGFAVFLSVADNYMRKNGMLPLPPTVMAIVFMGSILSVELAVDFLRQRSDTPVFYLLRSNSPVLLPFATLAFLSLLFSAHPRAYWGDEKKWIFLQTYDFFIFLGASILPALAIFRRHLRMYAIIGLFTLLGSIYYEIQNPGTFSSVPNRAAGFPSNSNWGALVCVMICSMSLGYRDGASRLLDVLLFALTATGLYFTLSRSGMLNFLTLVSFYITVAILGAKDRRRTILQIVGGFGMLFVALMSLIPLVSKNAALTSGASGANAQNRLLALLNGEVVDDGSAADRIEAARETLDMINSSPIIGNGTGFNRRMRQTPHNLYLKLWVDSGICGMGVWIALLLSGFWLFTARRYRPGQALVIVTFIGGFFSHNILEQRTFLLLFGAASSMSLYQAGTLLTERQQKIERVRRILARPPLVTAD